MPFTEPVNAGKRESGLQIVLQHGGRYWLVTRTSGNLCPSAGRLGQADALDRAIEIAPGMKQTLEVTFNSLCGEIQATSVDRAGKPVPKAQNLLLMTGTPDDPGDQIRGQSDDA